VRNNAVLCPQEKPVKIERFVTTANPAQWRQLLPVDPEIRTLRTTANPAQWRQLLPVDPEIWSAVSPAIGLCHSSSVSSPASQRDCLDSIIVRVGFVVDKVALGHVFSEYFGFPYQLLFHKLLHIR
jgi:hypothetical protein